QINDTRWRGVQAEGAGTAFGGAWLLSASAGTQTYHQTFSAVADDRASERLTAEQRVPSRFGVGQAQWSRGFGGAALLFGVDARVARSTVNETRYPAGTPVVSPTSGGREEPGGGYARA